MKVMASVDFFLTNYIYIRCFDDDMMFFRWKVAKTSIKYNIYTYKNITL